MSFSTSSRTPSSSSTICPTVRARHPPRQAAHLDVFDGLVGWSSSRGWSDRSAPRPAPRGPGACRASRPRFFLRPSCELSGRLRSLTGKRHLLRVRHSRRSGVESSAVSGKPWSSGRSLPKTAWSCGRVIEALGAVDLGPRRRIPVPLVSVLRSMWRRWSSRRRNSRS